jgi:uncharacterized protein YraI
MRRLFAAILVVCCLAFNAGVCAETRLALVMGNADYRGFQLSKLSTPHNDFRLMADVLKRRMSYTVFGGTDLSLEEMRLRIVEFVARVREAGRNTTAVVFFSGHGMEVAEENFLFPVDAIGPFTSTNIRQKAVSLTWLLSELVGAGAAVNVVILDACRNDGTKSQSKGFVPVVNPPGTIVAYATAPGHVATDGHLDATGASPYSRALAATIAKEDWSAFEVLSKVRDDVFRITKGEQTPWERINLQGRPFAFNPSIILHKPLELAIPPSRIACERHQGFFEVVDVPSWDHLNIRNQPRQSSPTEPSNIIAKIPPGTKGVDLNPSTCDAEGWCQVQYLCSKGYTHRRYLRAMPGPVPVSASTQVAPSIIIGLFRVHGVETHDVLNVREAPISTAPIMFAIPANTLSVTVHYCGQPQRSRDNWCFVTYDGRQGWANGSFLRNATTGEVPPRQAALH